MKKLSIISVVSLIFMLNVASMCSNDDDPQVPLIYPANPAPVINIVSQGTWRITFYQDSGVDETNDFNGYNFTFGASNVLTATNGVDTYTGNWSVTNSDSNDDNPNNDLDFNISFSAPPLFSDELTDDWDIISFNSNKIKLIDVSGGNGGTDYLTFEKN